MMLAEMLSGSILFKPHIDMIVLKVMRFSCAHTVLYLYDGQEKTYLGQRGEIV